MLTNLFKKWQGTNQITQVAFAYFWWNIFQNIFKKVFKKFNNFFNIMMLRFM
jgi:hypothetical protein